MSWYPKRTRPIETSEGIKARSVRGSFGENWWAERWIKALEAITDAGRLRRGRTYARKGQVLSLEEKKGAIQARVQGSRSTPYRVQIRLTPLSPQEWDQVTGALAERAIFSAQLLAGEMPPEVEEAFAAAGVSLFPARSVDLETSCSCPDWANPCKHVAATHYILGEQFDTDPFLLFRLRGREQERLFADLRARRAAGGGESVAEEPVSYDVQPGPDLAESLDDFWRTGAALDHFPTYLQEPGAPLPVLRRLGQPVFLADDVEAGLGPLYRAASRRALAAAYAPGAQASEAQRGQEPGEMEE